MDPDFAQRRHHFHYPHHLGFAGLHGLFLFEWLPLLVCLLVTVAVAWILFGGNQFEPTSRAIGRHRRTADSVRRHWQSAVRCLAVTAGQFAAYECDPVAVLRHPELADVTRPATARFIHAFTEANALATDEYPGVKHAERFIPAAQRAQRSWQDAVDAAHGSGGAW